MVLYLALLQFVEQNILSARFVALRFALWFLDLIHFGIDGKEGWDFYVNSNLYVRFKLTATCSVNTCMC